MRLASWHSLIVSLQQRVRCSGCPPPRSRGAPYAHAAMRVSWTAPPVLRQPQRNVLISLPPLPAPGNAPLKTPRPPLTPCAAC